MLGVLSSHQKTYEPHEPALWYAGRRVKDFYVKYRGPLAAADLLPAVATAYTVPPENAAATERLMWAGLVYVGLPVVAYVTVSLIWGWFRVKSQRDYARMERDFYRLKAGQVVHYAEMASMIKWLIKEGRRLYRSSYWSRHPGWVRSDAQAWHSMIKTHLGSFKRFSEDWGDPPEVPVGRKPTRQWVKERMAFLKGLI